ncbi:MAG: Crp/Fnr family transcriptional regulator [Lachnospiraceae bacterium]|nr:Crp/Fnr family transcriptional regulator [Lachnospiraceae bacterium]
MINQKELHLLHKGLLFWDKLTQPEKELLNLSANSVHFNKGQSIHCGETECIGLLIVENGSIRTYITSEEGREVTLFRLQAGDICILSASCVLETIDFDVSVDAETDCDCIQISALTLSRLFSENVYVELFSYKLATERFSDVMWVMQQLLFTRFDKRLAAFLLDESSKLNTPDIRLTHEEIARYLGSAREVVSRMLKYFSKEGYVTLSRGGIHIADKDSLRGLL